MKITLVNPSKVLRKLLAKWQIQEGYTLTCRSRTCSCFSHDSGFDWREYEFPTSIWAYVEKKIGRSPGSPSSHKSCYWKGPILERELKAKERGEYAAETARGIIAAASEAIQHARFIGDYGVIEKIRQARSDAFGGDTEVIWRLSYELRCRAEEKRQRDWAKHSARRNGVAFPLAGKGWKFIPA